MKVRTRKLAVFVTCLGVAAAFPVLGSADQGGHPNSHSKACKPHKDKKNGKTRPPGNGAGKGKKCGWNGPLTVTTVATPTVPTGTETETETTTGSSTTTN